MLEFLTRWTPLAQFLGPLIAGVAAVFAARSAGAAREAARTSREAQDRANDAYARERKPSVSVSLPTSTTYDQTVYTLKVENTGEENEARRVRVQVRRPNPPLGSRAVIYTAFRPEYTWQDKLVRDVLGPGLTAQTSFSVGDRIQTKIEEEGTRFVTTAYIGRLDYFDENELAEWRVTFRVVEGAELVPTGQIIYSYYVDGVSRPQRVRDEDEEDGPKDGLGRRFVLVWQVVRGSRQVEER